MRTPRMKYSQSWLLHFSEIKNIYAQIVIITKQLLKMCLCFEQNEVNAIKWDPQGQLLASCSDDMTLKVCYNFSHLILF